MLCSSRSRVRLRPAVGRPGVHITRVACLVAAVMMASMSPTWSEPYRLGPQDKLRIKVVEWRVGKGEYQEWTALNAEYTVNAAGAIALPLVGEVPAEGRTTDEVAKIISDALQKRAGLVGRPDTAVEVIQFRPVYIVGDIEHPGEYAYRPGVTVLQMVGIAGGMHRITEAGLLRLERDRIAAAGTLESARLDLRRTIARRARLQTELETELEPGNTIPMPPELRDEPDGARLIAEETAVMTVRRDALRSQLAALAALKDLYAKEVQSLDGKMAIQEKQISFAKRELKNVGSLVEKGLAVSSRELTLQQMVADLESRMLDFQTASLRAKQEIGKADRDSVDLQQQRKTEILAELQEARGALEQLGAKLQTSRALVDEAMVTAPRLALERSFRESQAPLYSVVRRIDGVSRETRVEEHAVIEPGDVVRVDRAPWDASVPAPHQAADREGDRNSRWR